MPFLSSVTGKGMGYEIKMAANGRIVVPLAARKELGLEHGGVLSLDAVGGEVRLRSRLQGLRDAQRMTLEMIKGTDWEHKSAVDWLIEERREAFEQEERKLLGDPKA
jgi:bifunctional DNA-binding transcriptional regulator/antitoxin component of YhaV-PrlF toxin-antitoxin module